MSEKPTYLRVARLLTAHSADRSALGYGTALAYEPMSGPNDKGQLLVAIELMTIAPVGQTLVNKIIETAKKEYFKDQGLDVTKSFENMLMAVNDELGTIAESGQIDWIGKLSAIIAVAKDGEIHFSKAGNADAYLFRKETTSHISESLNPPIPDHHPLKTFANIISGDLYVGDKLLITTPGLFYHLSLPEVHNVVTEHSPGRAIEYFGKLFDKNTQNRLSMLVIEATTPEILSYEITDKELSEVVIHEGKKEKTSKFPREARPVLNILNNTVGRALGSINSKLQSNNLKLSIPTINKRGLLSVHTLKSKPVLLLLAIVLLASSIGINGYRKGQAKIREEAAASLEKARDLSEEAEASLLLDKKSGIKLLNEALEIAKGLAGTKAVSSEAKSLVADIEQRLMSAKAIFDTKEDQFADLTPVLPGNPVSLFLDGSNLYIFDSSGTIVKTNTSSKEIEQIHNKPLADTIKDVAFNERRGRFYLLGSSGVYSFSLATSKLAKLKILGTGGWSKGDKIETYALSAFSDYIYILSKKGKKIYYHISYQDGYTSGRTYYSSKSLASASDISVDESVYVLFKDSRMVKLVRGKTSVLKLKPLEKLTETTTLTSDRSVKNLYVFDKASNSLMTFNKKGTYKQANPNSACCLSFFEVYEKKSTFYILIGKQLFSKDFRP